MTKELLISIISNTNINLISLQNRYAFELLKSSVFKLKDGESLDLIQVNKILGNTLRINFNKNNKIIIEEVNPKLELFDEKLNNQYFHNRKTHPTLPIAINIENGKLVGYNIHFTSTNKDYIPVFIQNKKIDEDISKEQIILFKEKYPKEFSEINKSYYENKLINLLDEKSKLAIIRPKGTWFYGEYGNLPLMPIKELSSEKIQYISPVLIKWDLENEEYFKLFLKSNREQPSLEYRELSQDSIKNMDLIETFSPLNGNFSKVSNNDLIFIDLKQSTHNFDLYKIDQFRDYLLLSANISKESYLYKTGKLERVTLPDLKVDTYKLLTKGNSACNLSIE